MKPVLLLTLCFALLAGCVPVVTSPASTAVTETRPSQDTPPVASATLPPASTAGVASPLPATADVEPTQGTEATGGSAIRVVRSGGFAGRTEAWEIYSDGRIVQPDGSVRRVPPEAVAGLMSDLEGSGLLVPGTAGPPEPGSCRDCYVYEISVDGNGQAPRSVSFVENPGAISPALIQILGKLTALLAAGR